MDWEAVQAAIKQFSTQTEDVLEKYLGKERFQRIKRNSVFTAEQ